MKILQFGKFYYPTSGGIEHVMYEITEGLNASGYSCDVLCSNTKAKYEENLFHNYTVYKTSSYGMFKSTSITPQLIYKLYKLHKDYDVIHVHHPDPMAFLALYIVRPQSKVIIHWHSDIIRQKKVLKFFLPLQRWVLNFSDKIITTSANYAKFSVSLQGFKEKIANVPIGISSANYRANELHVEKIKSEYKNKKIILAIGRLVSYKGFIHLVQSAKFLNNDFVILIAGTGPDEVEILKYISSHKLEEKVKLLGHISEQEKYDYLEACFIFCLPSITKAEAFGVVLLEAMIFSKPIVSSDIKESGMNWVNEKDVSGLHVTPASPQELADTFIKLQKDEVLYNKLSKNALQRYKTLFTRKSMINALINVYQSS